MMAEKAGISGITHTRGETKMKEVSKKGKITVIFKELSTNWVDPVEFEADTFTLLNAETDHPMYAIVNENPVSNVFIDYNMVYAIGFSEDIAPLTKKIKELQKKAK